MTAGLNGERAMDAADQLRLEQMLAETSGRPSTFGRERSGYFPKGTFELTTGLIEGLLRTVRGEAWWRQAKHAGFIPAFVADVDALPPRSAST